MSDPSGMTGLPKRIVNFTITDAGYVYKGITYPTIKLFASELAGSYVAKNPGVVLHCDARKMFSTAISDAILMM